MATSIIKRDVDEVCSIITNPGQLHNGLNAVRIPANTPLNSNTTTPNNMRGFITKDGANTFGIISSYDMTVIYFITSDSLSHWNYVYKMRGGGKQTFAPRVVTQVAA